MTSWLFTDTAPAALLDELVKIGESSEVAEPSNKERILRALKTVGLAGAGVALGGAAASGLQGKLPGLDRFVRAKPPITDKKLSLVRWGLPIAGGLAAILGNAYRRKVDEGLLGKRS